MPAVEEGPGSSAPQDGSEESLIDLLQGLLHDLPGLLGDRVELLSLELKRAAAALAQIVMLVVALAVLALTAWLALWIGLARWLIALDVPWLPWLPVLLLVHALAIAVAWLRVRRLARLIALPATRRHLTLSFDAAAAAVPPLATPTTPSASHG